MPADTLKCSQTPSETYKRLQTPADTSNTYKHLFGQHKWLSALIGVTQEGCTHKMEALGTVPKTQTNLSLFTSSHFTTYTFPVYLLSH